MKQAQVPFLSFINLVPFYFGPYGATLEDSFLTLMQNILLTIPFGFGISFVADIQAKYFLWVAFAVGLGIEGIQLMISLMLGYPYRFIDVNDVLMNAAGFLIGYGLFRIFACLYLWVMQRFSRKLWGLAAYIYDIASRSSPNSASKGL